MTQIKINKINFKEFVEQGYLQEVNRLFFHPLGLALQVEAEDDVETNFKCSIWDYRDDPEGIFFGDDIVLNENFKKKVVNVERQFSMKRKTRRDALGFFIQPYYKGDEK